MPTGEKLGLLKCIQIPPKKVARLGTWDKKGSGARKSRTWILEPQLSPLPRPEDPGMTLPVSRPPFPHIKAGKLVGMASSNEEGPRPSWRLGRPLPRPPLAPSV